MNKIKLTVTLTCLAVMIFATTFTDRVHSQQGSQDGQQQTGAGSQLACRRQDSSGKIQQ
jgi:hypothetical protein